MNFDFEISRIECGTRKFTLRYQEFEMNFHIEILRIECGTRKFTLRYQ